MAKDEMVMRKNFVFEVLDSLPLTPNFLVPEKSSSIIAQAETVVATGAASHPYEDQFLHRIESFL